MLWLVRLIAPKESLPDLKYIQVPFADREIYGHKESDADEVKMELAVAYKSSKVSKQEGIGWLGVIRIRVYTLSSTLKI